jgi:hypothetical protein
MSPHWACRADANQDDITAGLRALGCSVDPIHTLGRGRPDLLVGYQQRNFLFEIKDPSQPASKRKLTKDEAEWHAAWRGQVSVIVTWAEGWTIIRGAA